MHRIVVGVDGTKEATEALRWALDEAELRGARLTVVHAYQIPPLAEREFAPSHYMMGSAVPALTAARERQETERFERARHAAEAVVARQLRNVGAQEREVPVRPVALVSRHPGRTLVRQSADADLLVVGARPGRPRLLGSVSRWCVTHARCPVTVIGPRQRTGRRLSRAA